MLRNNKKFDKLLSYNIHQILFIMSEIETAISKNRLLIRTKLYISFMEII